MKFIETGLSGLYLIEIQAIADARGFFARSFCVNEFASLGLDPAVAQCNISFNERAGTLRGMHYQEQPHEEARLVRCTSGAIYDVAVDRREDSSTYLKWFAVELNSENRRMLFVPRGFAHGFQTLVDRTEVSYIMSEFYHPEGARGLRWNDPALSIRWPFANPIISEKDSAYAMLHGSEE